MHNRADVDDVIRILIGGLVILSLVYSFNRINFSNYFPIKTVRVFGVERLDQHEVQQVLLPLVHRGFFKVNVEDIRDRLL